MISRPFVEKGSAETALFEMEYDDDGAARAKGLKRSPETRLLRSILCGQKLSSFTRNQTIYGHNSEMSALLYTWLISVKRAYSDGHIGPVSSSLGMHCSIPRFDGQPCGEIAERRQSRDGTEAADGMDA